MAFGAHIPPGLGKPLPKAPGRVLNKASGKMETKQQMAKYRVPAAARALGAPRGPAPQSKPSGPAHAGPPLSPLEMNPAQLHAYNTTQVKQNTQAELLPLRQRTAEIGNEESTAAKRYGGFGEATQANLGALQGQQQASAKTSQNEAAESALRASKAIETAGQTSAQQNAGYVDPQLKAALGNQTANVAAAGQAHEAGTAQANQNEASYLTNLRAAAAQRVTEGQQGIISTYGKQRGEVGGQERQALARMPGQISKLDTEALNTKFNQGAVKAKLEAEGVKLGIAKGKLQIEGKNAATKEFSAKNTAETRAASQRNAEAKLGLEKSKFGSDREYKNAVLNYQKLGQESKSKYDAAAERYKHWQETKGAGGSASTTQTSKAAQQIFTAFSVAQGALGPKGKAGGWSKGTIEKVRQELLKGDKKSGPHDALTVSAALNLAVYGRLGPNDKRRLQAQGVDTSAFG